MTTRLRVTSIERYHLYDDTPENPNVIGCDLTVRGPLHLENATAALREAAQRHPMVAARLDDRYWQLDPAEARALEWVVVTKAQAEAQAEALGSGSPENDLRVIDLAHQLTTRFILRRGQDVTHLSFRMHHAAADGGGGLQFVADWLLTYHRLSSGSELPRSRETNPQLLAKRNHLKLLTREFLGKLWVQPIAILGASKFLLRKVQAVVPPRVSPQATEVQDFQVISSSLSTQQVEDLRRLAAEGKATINELILRGVFLGIHQFRKSQGLYQPREWLRLVVPISIRDFSDRRLPAVNRASIVQLDRTDRDFADPQGMTWGLNYELGNIKKWNLEKTFLLLMRCFALVPGWVKRIASKDVCRATSVVTNLGSPFERLKLERQDGKLKAGDLLVENVGLMVPLRKNTPLGFATLRYAGEQKICMHYDPQQMTAEQAREVHQIVMGQLIEPPETGNK